MIVQKKIKKEIANKFLVIVICLFVSIGTYGQGRTYIREQIHQNGECRNVAITETNGDLMLYGRNGWAGTGLPQGLSTALNELNKNSEYIDDVQLTEQGRWLILYGDNGFRWKNIPYSLERKLREFNDKNEVITSVTFNDAGDWIVITTNYYTSSDSRINDWLKEGNVTHGLLWAACVTGDAIVAVYAEGYRFLGNVPQSLKTELNKTQLDVYRLKISGTAWFFADKNGNYQYRM